MAPKPKAPEAPKPKAPEAPKPKAPGASKPKAPEASKPKGPEASKPKAPEASKPKAKSTKIPEKREKKKVEEPDPLYHNIAALMTFLLFLVTTVMLALCAQEWHQSIMIETAVKQCREFASTKDKKASKLSDVAVLRVCQEAAEELAVWEKKNRDMQVEMIDITKMLKSGWEANRGFIYLFHVDKMKWNAAKMFCNKHGSHLLSLETKNDEEFIESHLSNAPENYWAGGYRPSSASVLDWRWTESEALIPRYNQFWIPGEPKATPGVVSCVMIIKDCKTKFKCWIAQQCEEMHRPICRRRPNPEWAE